MMVGGLVAAFGLGGCGYPTPKPKAASSLRCDQAQIVVDETHNNPLPVTGCGRTDVMFWSGNGWSSFRERLVFELSCADAEIDVRILTPLDYGVTGCGKKLVYKFVPGVGIVANTSQTN
jgi:hypothetical protein